MKKICLYIITGFAFIACTKTNEEAEIAKSAPVTVPVISCDTVNMKYTANVLPIMQANCYSCHGNGQVEGGVSLDSYTKLKQRVNSKSLMAVITHASGYPAMPYGLPKLSDCDINKIKNWIDRGALNN
jgi:cytochrome c553